MQCNRSKSDERYVAVLKTEDKQAEKQQQQIKSKSHLKRHWENYFVMAVVSQGGHAQTCLLL